MKEIASLVEIFFVQSYFHKDSIAVCVIIKSLAMEENCDIASIWFFVVQVFLYWYAEREKWKIEPFKGLLKNVRFRMILSC